MTVPWLSERPVLCLVTDRSRFAGQGRSAIDAVVMQVAEAAAAGVTLIQIRERDLETADLQVLTGRCVQATRGTASRVVVNDRVDVALACGADGVHLRSDSAAAERVRAIVPASFVIGRSVHSEEEARRATAHGAVDYLIFGTVFPTRTKPADHAWAGVERLHRAARAVEVPVLAIGGITGATVGAVAETGAAGVAAIGYFQPGTAGTRAVAEVADAIRRAFRAQPACATATR